jgi:hypothetical protein
MSFNLLKLDSLLDTLSTLSTSQEIGANIRSHRSLDLVVESSVPKCHSVELQSVHSLSCTVPLALCPMRGGYAPA